MKEKTHIDIIRRENGKITMYGGKEENYNRKLSSGLCKSMKTNGKNEIVSKKTSIMNMNPISQWPKCHCPTTKPASLSTKASTKLSGRRELGTPKYHGRVRTKV